MWKAPTAHYFHSKYIVILHVASIMGGGGGVLDQKNTTLDNYIMDVQLTGSKTMLILYKNFT